MADVTYTVPNKSGSYDGDMVVKQYSSMTINSGDTVTVDQPCRGLMILVQGDCTINGTLTMTSRGPLANPTTSGANDSNSVSASGLRFPFVTSGDSDTLTAAATLLNGCGTDARDIIAKFPTLSSNGVVKSFVRQGAAGGSQASGGSGAGGGNPGSNGSAGQSGGGASGSWAYQGTGHAGSYGSCWGGGSGGGAENNNGSGASAATAWGGSGGSGASGHNAAVGGGAGNPDGNMTFYGNSESGNGATVIDRNAFNGGNGPGGAIVLIVGGNLTIGASGSILAQGARAEGVNYTNNTDWYSTGGGAGGGIILIAHKGTYTNGGTVSCAALGGGRFTQNGGGIYNPGSQSSGSSSIAYGGGDGSVQVVNIS